MRTPMFQICLLLSMLLLVSCGGGTTASLPPTAATSSPATTQALPAAPLSLYLGGATGTISALNAADGTVRWRVQLAQASTPAVVALDEGVVYASANDPESPPSKMALYAFRASDGSVLWHQMLSGASVAAVSQGVVYLAFGRESGASSPPSEVEALRAQDGSEVWHTSLEGTGPIAVRIATGTLYVTSFSSLLPGPGYYYASTYLYALTASSGAVRWHRQLSRTNAVAAVTTAQVYLLDTGTDVVCEPRMLHILDASSGAEQWQREESFLTLIGVEQTLAFVEAVPEGCNSSRPFEQGGLAAVHTTDGSSAWQSTIPFGPGAIANGGVLYVPSEDGDLAAYRAGDGFRLWHAQGEGGGIDLFDGALYTSLEGRGLDALSPTTGTVVWRYSTPDGVAVLRVANGIFYGVVSHLTSGAMEDSTLVALRAGTGKLLWRVEIDSMGGTPLVG